MILDYLAIAFKNLVHRKLRSWLTVLGVLIGIVAIVSLLSLSRGLTTAVEEEFAKFGIDKIIIEPDIIGVAGSGGTVTLGEKDIKVIEGTRGVQEINRAIYKSGKTSYKDNLKFPFIIGVDFEDGISIVDDYG